MSNQTRDPLFDLHALLNLRESDWHDRKLLAIPLVNKAVSERATDAQTIATLQDENARLKAALEQAGFAAQAAASEISDCT